MDTHRTQADRVLDVLANALFEVPELYADYGWVPLPQLMDLRIASLTRRISDLRKRGFNVECKTEWIDGVRHSKYRLVR